MQVLKFGGTSVANAENISKTITIILEAVKNGKTLVVVSALGGVTDMLLQSGRLAATGDESYKGLLAALEQRHLETVRALIPLAQQSSVLSMVKKRCNEIEDICNGIFLLGELSERTKDKIMSYGEVISTQIISARLSLLGAHLIWKDSRDLIVTDSSFGFAAVDFGETNRKIKAWLATVSEELVMVPGFIAADRQGITTTLGRGGSDYTAAIFGAATEAVVVEIWTDVSGMMTADPRIVPHAKAISQLSYQEAMELSHFGAKVIYPPTIQPLMNSGIPVRVKNTFAPEDPGTLIQRSVVKNGNNIRGISSIGQIALLSLEGGGMVGIPGFSRRLFEALSDEKINVILITQGSSEHSICVAVEQASMDKAKQVVDHAFEQEIGAGRVDPLVTEPDLAIIALVGDNMKSHPGVSGKMFGALGRNGVNVRAIAQGSSERNISAVIASGDVKKSINLLHEEFFETTYKQLNLFLVGVGNVGSRFLEQLKQQEKYLAEHLRLQVNVTGLANSKKMLFSEEGIDPDQWKEQLDQGAPMDLTEFIENIRQKNLRNSLFADITASEEVAACYGQLLEKSISVVACNKVAASSSYAHYKKLKQLATEFNCLFLFETNVGAGLPVIGTLNDLLRSGDKINRIQAVLSGTLNFVFNAYDGSIPFAQIVRQAQTEGYTEPDPRLDLSGTDVMRKIMILAREAGERIELSDIANRSFLPASCMEGSVEDFYAALQANEGHFKKIYDEASGAGKKLKFVATYELGRASVGLQPVDPSSDFYHLYGKDNVVLFYTDRYAEQPLVVKGAGAGAEVTASGVFADIIRAARA